MQGLNKKIMDDAKRAQKPENPIFQEVIDEINQRLENLSENAELINLRVSFIKPNPNPNPNPSECMGSKDSEGGVIGALRGVSDRLSWINESLACSKTQLVSLVG